MAAADYDPQARAKAVRENILRRMSEEERLEYELSRLGSQASNRSDFT